MSRRLLKRDYSPVGPAPARYVCCLDAVGCRDRRVPDPHSLLIDHHTPGLQLPAVLPHDAHRAVVNGHRDRGYRSCTESAILEIDEPASWKCRSAPVMWPGYHPGGGWAPLSQPGGG